MESVFEVTIGGVTLDDKVVTGVEFTVLSPEDVDAKGVITCANITVTGNILNEEDKTSELASWAADDVQTGYEYKNVSVKYKHDKVTVREYTLPNAFVVDYKETFGDHDGNGTFEISMNQQRQKLDMTEVNGGY